MEKKYRYAVMLDSRVQCEVNDLQQAIGYARSIARTLKPPVTKAAPKVVTVYHQDGPGLERVRFAMTRSGWMMQRFFWADEI